MAHMTAEWTSKDTKGAPMDITGDWEVMPAVKRKDSESSEWEEMEEVTTKPASRRIREVRSQRKKKGKATKYALIALLLGSVVILGVFIGTWMTVRAAVEDGEVTLTNMRIMSVSKDGGEFIVDLGMTLDSAAPNGVSTVVMPMVARISRENADERCDCFEPFGTMTMSELYFPEGETNVLFRDVVLELTVDDADDAREEFHQMLTETLQKGQVAIGLEGEIRVNLAGIIFPAPMSKYTLLGGMGGLTTALGIQNVRLSGHNEGIHVDVDAALENPSGLTAHLAALRVKVMSRGISLGSMQVLPFHIQPGLNNISLNGDLSPEDMDIAAEIVRDYVDGDHLFVQLICEVHGASVDDEPLAVTVIGVEIENSGLGLNFTATGSDITGASPSTLEVTINVTVDNPSFFEGNLGEVSFDVYRWVDGAKVILGVAALEDFEMLQGEFNVSLLAVLTTSNLEAMNQLASDNIAGIDADLCIHGSADGNLVSSAIRHLEFNVTLEGGNTTMLESVQVTGFTFDGSSWGANSVGTIQNPFNFEVNITRMMYTMFFNDTDGCCFIYSAAYNINAGTTNNDMTTNPLMLPPLGSVDTVSSVDASSLELGARMNDEMLKDQLYMDFVDGEFDVNMAGGLTVSFVFHHVHVIPPW